MVAQAVAALPPDLRIQTEFRGAVARLFDEAEGEIVISGPAGTGKTRSILEWIHLRCSNERLRVLMLRKTQESLKSSAMVTFQEQVLYGFDGKRSVVDGVAYFGGNSIRPAEFTYEQTGAKIVMAGMDNVAKVLSTEYDIVFVNETTELTLDEWEQVTGRTDRPRLGKQRPPSLVLGDCNPGPPTHWIKQREADGKLKLWKSVHEDNPAMWDRIAKKWTAAGLRYLNRLDQLTGVRYLRLRLGQWVAAEGQVYEGWSEEIHHVEYFEIPAEWPRFWVIDFGFVHAFVWQWWAIEPDGGLVLYREIYKTERLVEDHAVQGMALTKDEPKPIDVITDHDAEDRATFEIKTGYRTTPAHKSVSDGIQAVASRLKVVNGRTRIKIIKGCRVERDQSLAEKGKPTCTAEEFPAYIWDTRQGRRKGEEPLKEDDHGMDGTRYAVAYRDLRSKGAKARSY